MGLISPPFTKYRSTPIMFQPSSIHPLSTFRGSRRTSIYLIPVSLQTLVIDLTTLSGIFLSGDS